MDKEPIKLNEPDAKSIVEVSQYPDLHEHDREAARSSLETVLQMSASGIKGAFIINGAASLALLTFLGSVLALDRTESEILSADDVRLLARAVAGSLLAAALGTALAGVAQYLRYQSRLSYIKAGQFLYPLRYSEPSVKENQHIRIGNLCVFLMNAAVAMSALALTYSILSLAYVVLGIL